MTSVEQVLAKAVMDLVISIEMTDDEEIDPDVSTAIVEPVGFLLNDVSPEVRQQLVRLFREAAESEDVPERHAMAVEFPEAIGLVEYS
ncbi:hypothetical protein SAVIM338S_04626 [Streptomyces avidinii]